MIERPCREETSRPLEIVLRGRQKKKKKKEKRYISHFVVSIIIEVKIKICAYAVEICHILFSCLFLLNTMSEFLNS